MNDANKSISLLITEDKLKAFVTIRDKELVNKDLLYELLQEKGVEYGVDQEALEQLIKNPSNGTFIIANGKTPQEGQDSYVQYLFTAPASAAINVSDEKNIDYREIFKIPSVNVNTILAVYHSAIKGVDGSTVGGQVIPARQVVELNLRAGKGGALSPDGKSVTSEINGRPWAKKQGSNVTVGVDAIYHHEGDVDIKSGNLRFNGDVAVTGNITENMIADIKGNLKVFGFVSRATIKVSGHIEIVKVITASTITAGNKTVSFSKIKNKLDEIYYEIERLDSAAQQLLGNLRQRDKNITFGQVILTLMDKKFINLRSQVREITKLVKSQEQKLPRELEEAIRFLATIADIKALNVQNLTRIKKRVAEATTLFEPMDDAPSNVIAHSVWNSPIEATGDIKIIGQGVFNSHLTALGFVDINGIFRGGEMFAQASVKVGEIGGPMGAKTVVRTGKNGIIKANRVYNGSILQIGTRIYTVHKDENMILARVNKHGDIVLR